MSTAVEILAHNDWRTQEGSGELRRRRWHNRGQTPAFCRSRKEAARSCRGNRFVRQSLSGLTAECLYNETQKVPDQNSRLIDSGLTRICWSRMKVILGTFRAIIIIKCGLAMG